MVFERRITSQIASHSSLGKREMARCTSALSNFCASSSGPKVSGNFIELLSQKFGVLVDVADDFAVLLAKHKVFELFVSTPKPRTKKFHHALSRWSVHSVA